jgi:aminoglycoside 6-adenylyltransferase
MRSEQEMLDLIVDTARADARIRAVILNGSRANPHAPRDPFQDFDIVYLVTHVAPFRQDRGWVHRFGEILLMQMPEKIDDPPPRGDGRFIYLLQFTDGHRLDLTLLPLALRDEPAADSLSRPLLDKDGLFPDLAPPSERDYLPRPPTAKQFADCCNEFWWVSLSVAKGLWRGEILYAKHYLDHPVRAQLMKMLDWQVGVQTDFRENPGKFGKYLPRYLAPERWALLQRTYADAGVESTWNALEAMGDLFRDAAVDVAARCGFAYPHADDRRARAHLQHVRRLPRDAVEIY